MNVVSLSYFEFVLAGIIFCLIPVDSMEGEGVREKEGPMMRNLRRVRSQSQCSRSSGMANVHFR